MLGVAYPIHLPTPPNLFGFIAQMNPLHENNASIMSSSVTVDTAYQFFMDI